MHLNLQDGLCRCCRAVVRRSDEIVTTRTVIHVQAKERQDCFDYFTSELKVLTPAELCSFDSAVFAKRMRPALAVRIWKTVKGCYLQVAHAPPGEKCNEPLLNTSGPSGVGCATSSPS